MNSYRGLATGMLLLSLTGCSSIVQGTDQDVAVNTNPPGATCTLAREGMSIGTVLRTPGAVNVSKTKHDITITCEKEGYNTATYINDSGWESGSGVAGIALDVILTAGISSAIDSATGADNKYESPVNITMVPLISTPEAHGESPRYRGADLSGKWFAKSGAWQLYIEIDGGILTGNVRHYQGSAYDISGRIMDDSLVAAGVASGGITPRGSLSGSFPSVSLIQDGRVQASFELEKRI